MILVLTLVLAVGAVLDDLGLPSVQADEEGACLLPLHLLDRIVLSSLTSWPLPAICQRYRFYQTRTLHRLLGDDDFQLFFNSQQVESDPFRASATAFLHPLQHDSSTATALNWFTPERIVNVYDRAQFCEYLHITTGLLDHVIGAFQRPDHVRLVTGLQRINAVSILSQVRREFGDDSIPGAPAIVESAFGASLWILNVWPHERHPLTKREIVLKLACCGIRFSVDYYVYRVQYVSAEIYPFLITRDQDSFSFHVIRALNGLSQPPNPRPDLAADLIRLPSVRAAIIANPN